ncbi:MAG: DNA-processing protein DprA [Lachnospiraceae bacterium]|nr:DNA-processing protein DprA [Lachnospiraceae bacterium]
MTEKEYWYWLCNIPEMWQAKIAKLMKIFHTPQALYEASAETIRKRTDLSDAEIERITEAKKKHREGEELAALSRRGIRFVCLSDADYPERLRQLYDHPYGLYVRGELPDDRLPTAAIVGARACTGYGRQMTERLAKSLAGHGIQTVSGLARGIDSSCHIGTLAGGGKTFGILGCGIDVCYPPENLELFEECAAHGGIISEYPPGTQPVGWQFPHRNRLISGLADKVIVMEAKEKSGALITVDFALEQGKDVFALPGRVTDPCSKGCNRLIRQGAMLLTDTDDILAEFTGEVGEKARERIRILKENRLKGTDDAKSGGSGSSGRKPKNNNAIDTAVNAKQNKGEIPGHTNPANSEDSSQNPLDEQLKKSFSRPEAWTVLEHLDVMGKPTAALVEETGLSPQEVMIGLFELLSRNLTAEGPDGYHRVF